MDTALDNVTRIGRKSCFTHADNFQDEDFRSEQVRDVVMDTVTVSRQDSSSISDTCNEEEFLHGDLTQQLYSD
jgi:hypothetical protein